MVLFKLKKKDDLINYEFRKSQLRVVDGLSDELEPEKQIEDDNDFMEVNVQELTGVLPLLKCMSAKLSMCFGFTIGSLSKYTRTICRIIAICVLIIIFFFHFVKV